MYFLTERQKAACEAVWRSLERQEFPLGMHRNFLPQDTAKARYQVAQQVRMLDSDALLLVVDREETAHGALAHNHRFNWTERTMRAAGDNRPLLAALQPPLWRKNGP